MNPFFLPVAPAVYFVDGDSGAVCADCPQFLSTCGSDPKIGQSQEVSTPIERSRLTAFVEITIEQGVGYMKEVCLPLAESLGIISAEAGWEALAERSHPRSDDATTSPRELAGLYLYSFAKNLRSLYRLHKAGHPVSASHMQLMLLLSEQKGCVAGLLAGLESSRRGTIARGANGRRLIGTATRDRARQAAEKFRGKLSRDAASLPVAEAIGKAPATVRRLLSELFPGAEWDAP